MAVAMSSQRMFRVGMALGIVGVFFYVVAGPFLNWFINESNFASFGAGVVSGLFAVVQQITFYGGLFLVVGSFVVRSAEEVTSEIRAEYVSSVPAPRDLD